MGGWLGWNIITGLYSSMALWKALGGVTDIAGGSRTYITTGSTVPLLSLAQGPEYGGLHSQRPMGT